jgi:hypothetical protein
LARFTEARLHALPLSGSWLLASGFQLLASGFGLPTSDFQLQASGFNYLNGNITIKIAVGLLTPNRRLPMPLISDSDQAEIRRMLAPLKNSVTLQYFTQEFECQNCKAGNELYTEIAALSDKLELKIHDFVKEAALAESFGVDKIPALVLEGLKPNGIRFYGIPGGYEFMTLLEDILDVSSGEPELKPETIEAVRGLKKPVHIQVFVTPT